MRKRIFLVCLLAVFLAGVIGTPVYGAGTPQVMDGAELFGTDEVQSLTELIGQLEKETGWDIMAATTGDTRGEDATTWAELLFDQRCERDDGLICLIDMDNREIVLRTFGEAIYYVTDDRRDQILDQAQEAAADGDYSYCMELMLRGCGQAYERGIPSDQYTYDEDTGEIVRYKKPRRITPLEGLIAFLAALAAGGITVAAVVGKYRLKWGGYQYSFRENGKLQLTQQQDSLENQFVTHRHIPKNPPKSSGGTGSRSTVHTGAGGRTSGGGSRKF